MDNARHELIGPHDKAGESSLVTRETLKAYALSRHEAPEFLFWEARVRPIVVGGPLSQLLGTAEESGAGKGDN